MQVVVQLDEDRDIVKISGPFPTADAARYWVLNTEIPRVSADKDYQRMGGLGTVMVYPKGDVICFSPYGYPAWQIMEVSQ